jgi:DNA-directed RNA polymerase specialized sigma24 family protein
MDMVVDHLDAVWRAALAACGDEAVAQEVTADVLTRAARDAPRGTLVRTAVLDAVRRAPAPAFAAMTPAEREAVALARVAGCRVDEVATALGIEDRAARGLLTEGLRSALRRRRASGPRTLPPALGCGSAAS